MSILDTQKVLPSFSVWESMASVARDYGKNIPSQLIDIAILGTATGKLTPKEYYFYSLYDDRKYTLQDKKGFIGFAAQSAMNRMINDDEWRPVAKDKIIFAQHFQERGFPVARILAAYHMQKTLAPIATLRSADEMRAFLQGAKYPLFSKPVRGTNSLGAARLEVFDEASNEIVLGDGRRVEIDRFVEEAVQFRGGYIFQEVLHPHPDIAAICGDRIATVRMVVLLGDSGPELLRASWKIPAGGNIADNIWRGNILGSLDMETGRVLRATQGLGLKRRDLDVHPDSGKAITGMILPQWAAAKALCLDAAKTLPGLKLQSWDISICDSGPVLGEVNSGGDYYLPQLAADSGMLDAKFLRLLESRSHSWRARVFLSVVHTRLYECIHLFKTKARSATVVAS
jgi:Sugar-transfer associated ATP-grasp